MARAVPQDASGKRKAKRKPAPSTGPQGLPGPSNSNTSPSFRKAVRKKGLPKLKVPEPPSTGPQGLPGPSSSNTAKARVRQPPDSVDRNARRERVDGTKTKDYRKVVEYLLNKEYARKLERDYVKQIPADEDLSVEQLRAALYALRDPKTTEDEAWKLYGQTHLQNRTQLQETVGAPILKVLEQTTRPLHAVAGATDAALKGNNVPKAAWRGLKNEDKKTFSSILKDAGAPKLVSSVAGFGLDVALDPTTYVTFGTGSVLRQQALKANKAATAKALSRGLSKEQAERFGKRAEAKVVREGKDRRGLTVKMAGKEAPGIRRATAKAVPRRAVRRAAESHPARAVRNVAADVNPNVAPAGLSKRESREVVRATRTARAGAHRGQFEAQQRAIAVKKQIGADNYEKVIDAIEAGNLRSLSPELRKAAVEVRSQFRYANRLRRQAGIKGGERKNYIPHQLTDDVLEAEGKKPQGGRVGTRSIKPASSKRRVEQRPLKELREQAPGRYSDDLPQLLATRMTEATTSASKAALNRRLAEGGRRVPTNNKELKLGPGEAVFHIKGSDIKEITKATKDSAGKPMLERLTKAQRLSKGGKKYKASYQAKQGGRFVILNKQAVDQALESVTSRVPGSAIGRAFDKTQGGWKWIATVPNPGFHLRNLVGDSQNAYLAESVPRLARNMGQSARALKHLGTREKNLRTIDRRLDPSGAGLKIRGKKVTYAELVAEAEAVGAIRTGFIAREIPELAQRDKSLKTNRGRDLASAVSRQLQNREDVVRLATYIGGRKRGLSPEKAAERAAKYHFDYAHLTEFEKKYARRLMPFYTFSARNIPLQLSSVVTRPGKYANYQKIREEAANHFGYDEEQTRKIERLYGRLEKAGVKLPEGWERYLTEWEQRNAGIPISVGGEKYTLSFGLPLGDLNEFPGAAGKGQAEEWWQKGVSLLSPIPKNPVEWFANYSFFFRDQIQRDHSPLVAAPSWVTWLPQDAQKALGVTEITDDRTGKMVPGWPGKTDYMFKAVPGPPSHFQQFTTPGTDRRGKGTKERVAGWLGVKAVPFDPASAAVGLAYGQMFELETKIAALRQQKHRGAPIGADNPTREFLRLERQRKLTERVAYDAMKLRGDKHLPAAGAPPQPTPDDDSPWGSPSSESSPWDSDGSSTSPWD